MSLNAPVPAFTPLDVVKLRADVYPARVEFSFDEAVYGKVRVLMTADRVFVLVDAQGDPGLLYEARLESVTGDRHTLIAETADGRVIITRAGGCGCGSKLKTYKPYRRAVRMATA